MYRPCYCQCFPQSSRTSSRLVYTLVQKHILELEGVPPEVDRMAAEALEEYDEGAPLLKPADEEED